MAAFAVTGLCWLSGAAAQGPLNTQQIEQLTGLTGSAPAEEEGVFTLTSPRDDLIVTAGGVKITPAMGLTSWAAFKNTGDRTIMMGDLVLEQEQVNAVIDTALDNGLVVTALHNHFFWETPRILFMHIEGEGDQTQLATAAGKVFSSLKDTGKREPAPDAKIDPANTSLNPQPIDSILNKSGTLKNGVYKIVFGRTIQMNGHDVDGGMGVNTWAAFAGSDAQAVVDGDFVMAENEVQDVLKALRSAKINIVAIHNHMIGESPRMVFLHYWGTGAAATLAQGVKAALDTQAGK